MRLRGTAVGYWHGEGTAGPQPREDVARAAENVPARPVVNLSAGAIGGLGPALGADRLGGTVVELAPDEEPEPYHYVHGREDWLLVLTGTPALRHPSGEEQLRAGDLLCFPEGLAGARQLLSRGDSVARALLLSTTGLPVNAHYPDTGHWMIRNGAGPGDTALLMSRTPDRLRSPHDGRDRRGPRDQETGT
jgi:uncharacterized cupin superfamily protein